MPQDNPMDIFILARKDTLLYTDIRLVIQWLMLLAYSSIVYQFQIEGQGKKLSTLLIKQSWLAEVDQSGI